MSRLSILGLTLLIVLISFGCSDLQPPTEPSESNLPASEPAGYRSTLGFFTIRIDPGRQTLEIIRSREGLLHLNALKFLEPPANLHLSLASQPVFNGNIVDVDVALRNPYLGLPRYTGFDVCGLLITNGSQTGFSDPDIVMPGPGDCRLLNADGYTRWWNPSEFPYDGTIFGYSDGLLGTPYDNAGYNATLNGFKYFADDLEPNDPVPQFGPEHRGKFTAGQQNVRHYTIDFTGGLVFNYAVDANWAKPDGDPPFNVPDDFPPKANRPEAYGVEINVLQNNLFYDPYSGYAGGKLILELDVRDHFNAELNSVYAESLSGIPVTYAESTGGGEGFQAYELELYGGEITHFGSGELLITVESEKTDYQGLLPGKSICAYFKHSFDIEETEIKGWVKTWGSSSVFPDESYPNYFSRIDEQAYKVAVNASGDILTVGYFGGITDFDSGIGEEMRVSEGLLDAFVVKYNTDGDLLWVRSWGGPLHDRARGIKTDSSGNIYVTGDFSGTVDFDPGPGENIIIANSTQYHDSYLSMFDDGGNYLWTITWGGTGATIPYGIELDNYGDIYVSGEFLKSVDFDPGIGEDYHQGGSNWLTAFLLKLDPSGNFIWARTWGGYGRQSVTDIAFDSLNDVYVSGNFSKEVDFDPGPDVVIHTSHGYQDVFLSKFNTLGEFEWVRVWGNSMGYDHGTSVVVTNLDLIMLVGRFVGEVDFDPGSNDEIRTSIGGTSDAYLTCFDPFGDFQWVKTWGGDGLDVCYDIAYDGAAGLYVAGSLQSTVDLDPGPGVDEYTSNGGRDSFLVKFDILGNYIWGAGWGGENSSVFGGRAMGLACDISGTGYVSGMYEGLCDFMPGPNTFLRMSNGGTDCYLMKISPEGGW